MKRLSSKAYWDGVHSSVTPGAAPSSRQDSRSRVKAAIGRLLGPHGQHALFHYGGYQLWDHLFPTHLPPGGAGLKVIEIGSAPGRFIVHVHQRLGYDVYGVEYSDEGAEVNRRVFAAHGLDPAHVLHRDFLDEAFHDQYAGSFDVVFSNGFIEHFEDAGRICDLHVDLLKPGGFLVISIPRFRKLNRALMAFFNRENLDIHNLRIMERKEFARLFADDRLETRFCGYFGTFTFGLFNTRSASRKRHVLRFCRQLQKLLNILFYLLSRHRGLENPVTSPYLLYIGVRKA